MDPQELYLYIYKLVTITPYKMLALGWDTPCQSKLQVFKTFLKLVFRNVLQYSGYAPLNITNNRKSESFYCNFHF